MSRRKKKKAIKSPPFNTTHLTLQEAHQLKPNDKIDHRDYTGKTIHSKIVEKKGTSLKIHYMGWNTKWDAWSDYTNELHLFAKPKSISTRPPNRFTHLKQGDYVDVNPLKHPSWKYGEITSVDKKSGQVEILYEIDNKPEYHWAHLDNENEIAQFLTKSNPINATQIAAEKTVNVNKSKRKLENIQCDNFIFDDNSNSQSSPPRKRRKLNVSTSGKNVSTIHTNPWMSMINSNEKYIPQWVQCTVCKKWRFWLVLTGKISMWKAPTNFTCSLGNTKYNTCSMAQQTDKQIAMEYNEVQLQGLEIQRNIIMQTHSGKVSEQDDKNNNNGLGVSKLEGQISGLAEKNKLLIQEKRNLKRQREQFKALNKQIMGKNFGLVKENNALKLEIDKMKNDKLLDVKSGKVHSMDLEELDELEMEFKNGINVIKDARDRLLESKLYCVACLKNGKDVFIVGCGHLDLCSECEKNMVSKVCPRCQVPYQSVTKINI